MLFFAKLITLVISSAVFLLKLRNAKSDPELSRRGVLLVIEISREEVPERRSGLYSSEKTPWTAFRRKNNHGYFHEPLHALVCLHAYDFITYLAWWIVKTLLISPRLTNVSNTVGWLNAALPELGRPRPATPSAPRTQTSIEMSVASINPCSGA